MSVVNVHEAKTQLSRLLARAEAGEEVVIARNGIPIARLVRYENRRGIRRFGVMKGRVVVDDSFFEPLLEAELGAWESGVPCAFCSTRMPSCGGWPAASVCPGPPTTQSPTQGTISSSAPRPPGRSLRSIASESSRVPRSWRTMGSAASRAKGWYDQGPRKRGHPTSFRMGPSKRR